MKFATLLVLLFFSFSSFAIKPKTVKELRDTSVKIMNLEMNSGGTGSIFKSYTNASHILTNKHVCRLIEQGGYVVKEERRYLITHYKKFKSHDLCLVRVKKNLKHNLDIARTLAVPAQKTLVSGHPNLLPHIATVGHLSSNVEIELVVGVKKCTEEDYQTNKMQCMFFGGIPEIEKFSSDVVSNLIKPGSSGSPVFNSDGELIGVVFAGSGRDFSHGYIVPHIYLLYFLQNAHRYGWTKVGTPVDDGGLDGRIFNYEKCEKTFIMDNNVVKDLCKRVKNPMIWRK